MIDLGQVGEDYDVQGTRAPQARPVTQLHGLTPPRRNRNEDMARRAGVRGLGAEFGRGQKVRINDQWHVRHAFIETVKH